MFKNEVLPGSHKIIIIAAKHEVKQHRAIIIAYHNYDI